MRYIALPLIVLGVVLHLWLGTMIGLAMAALGLTAHVVAAVVGGRRLLRHQRQR